MPRPHRLGYSGAFYHLFNRGVEKRVIVNDDQDRRTFVALWSETVGQFKLRLFAYCLMSNHYHFFIQSTENNLSKAMWFFSVNYSRYFNKRHQRVGPLYQGRFQARLVNHEAYALTLVRYIHQNPLEAALVKRLETYPWSSYGSYTGHFPCWNGLEIDWILSQFAKDRKAALESFMEFHKQFPSVCEREQLDNFRKKLI